MRSSYITSSRNTYRSDQKSKVKDMDINNDDEEISQEQLDYWGECMVDHYIQKRHLKAFVHTDDYIVMCTDGDDYIFIKCASGKGFLMTYLIDNDDKIKSRCIRLADDSSDDMEVHKLALRKSGFSFDEVIPNNCPVQEMLVLKSFNILENDDISCVFEYINTLFMRTSLVTATLSIIDKDHDAHTHN